MIHLTETDSTNNYLTALSAQENVKEFSIVRTDFQTAGKGQRGNSWESEKGKNLLFSFILYPFFLEARKQFLISKVISLAIKEVLESYSPDFSIKWPNDIYWKDQKICGMLIENELTGSKIQQSIIGIGLNVNQLYFHSNAPNPVSLIQVTRKEEPVACLLDNIMQRSSRYYGQLRQGEEEMINTRYHESLYRKEGFHLYKDSKEVFQARILRVESTGTLVLVDTDDRKRKYAFKEVQHMF